MRILLATALALSLPVAAFAAGGEYNPPSKPKCQSGFVYDKKTKSCVSDTGHSLDIEGLFQEVRALSHDGRFDDAQVLLAQMPADDDRTLTYLGFTNRKEGNLETAMVYYTRALEKNPANILARSYMGQGLVEQGLIKEAMGQLRAIRSHGGTGTWAEASLRTAIATGETFDW